MGVTRDTSIEHRDLVSKAIVATLSKEQADSLLARTFKQECAELPKQGAWPHKNDCMAKVLNDAAQDSTSFDLALSAVMAIHSRVLKEKPNLLRGLNTHLARISRKYNPEINAVESLDRLEVPFDNRYLPWHEGTQADPFFWRLVMEINGTFAIGAFSATNVLLRKLFENLLVEILRKKFMGDARRTQLYWNESRKQFTNFATLIKNLFDVKDEFGSYQTILSEDFQDFLSEIRGEGNVSAHSIDALENDQWLQSAKDKALHFSLLALRLLAAL